MTVGKIPLTPFRKGGILEKSPFCKGGFRGILSCLLKQQFWITPQSAEMNCFLFAFRPPCLVQCAAYCSGVSEKQKTIFLCVLCVFAVNNWVILSKNKLWKAACVLAGKRGRLSKGKQTRQVIFAGPPLVFSIYQNEGLLSIIRWCH